MMPRARLAIAPTLLLLALAGSLAAQPRLLHPQQAERVVEQWNRQLQEIDALLVAGESTKAYRRISHLLEEMSDRLMDGPAVGRALGVATVLRALAAYQLGRPDEALWHWHVAAQMFPEVLKLSMTAYGDAGPFLKARPPRRRDAAVEVALVKGGVTQPRKLRGGTPRIPTAKRGTEKVTIVVQAIISVDGSVRDPVVLKSEGELTLVCATLDSLRDWRFTPAKKDGAPVPVLYNLAVDFQP